MFQSGPGRDEAPARGGLRPPRKPPWGWGPRVTGRRGWGGCSHRARGWDLSVRRRLLGTVLERPLGPAPEPVWQVQGRVWESTFQHTDGPRDPQAPWPGKDAERHLPPETLPEPS